MTEIKIAITEVKISEWFLRIALSAGFLSASADRFGMWPKGVSAWGNWQNFVAYTKSLNSFVPDSLIPFLAYTATSFEIVLGILLLTNFKTNWVAKASSALLLLFALSMTFSNSIKAPLDYSVFTASASAFVLSILVNPKRNKEYKF
ncbi:MAG TPA: MauE/DoxX family redox-associated membrane protein [Flavobacterium sp.]|uniref:MauE/DoxX family redox-associated membrane protein n=1 Tax=Flavobacterium sp. TaxID=239 RepID=UPI002DB7EF0A|nr:MauE/DoxX family redox-associated membrane protein [Flavobacterium sp.]HEU4788459.1 MauE/DoxX family redox-associated membrane protein [Flavobacterium sp.]